MRLVAYRRPNGLFTLTRYTPVRSHVVGTDHDDLFVPHGDPVGRIDLCPDFIQGLTRIKVEEIGPFEGFEVILTANFVRRLAYITPPGQTAPASEDAP